MKRKDTKFTEIEPDGAPTALENVLLDALPQVRLIARGIHRRLPSHVPLEDLIQAGTLGLIDAIRKFNPTKHVLLKSYAKFRIRGAILDSLRKMDWGPRYLRGHGRSVEAARQGLRARFGREPSEEELAEELQISVEKFQLLEGAVFRLGISALDSESLDTQSERITNANSLATAEMDPFARCFQSEMRSYIERAQDGLSENERRVLTLYYVKEFTMKEVGRALGVGESRVSQIHSEAISYLREQLGNMLQTRKHNAGVADGGNSRLNTEYAPLSHPNAPRPSLAIYAQAESGRRQPIG